jgi:cell division protein FtsZ
MKYQKKMANIKVIGIGGGGGNMVTNMLKNGINKDVELILINTDNQVLNQSSISNKISIGTTITKGLGAGMKPDIGKSAAIETLEEIKIALENTDMVFIAAGLGGGTGTGAAPVIAKIAKDLGILTVSIVTIPFLFEGSKRKKLAFEGLEELREYSDSIIVIQNEKLIEISEHNLGIKDAFKLVDSVLLKAVSGITNVILNHSEDDINLDFSDVKTIMGHKGKSLIGIGEEIGENAAILSLEKAINSPLLEKHDFKKAKGLLIHFNIHPNYPLYEINKAMQKLEQDCNDDVQIIFGTTTNTDLKEDEVKIILVATGFDDIQNFKNTKTDEYTEKFKTTIERNVLFIPEIELDKPTWFRNKQMTNSLTSS